MLNIRAGLFILDLNHAPWGCGEFVHQHDSQLPLTIE